MNKELLTVSVAENELEQLVEPVISCLAEYPVLLLKGNLGSGKTTFARKLLRHLGIQREISSPTFNLVNVYPLEDGKELYHFDLYRIKHPEELEEIGFFEYLESGNICLIEWPEIAEAYIAGKHLLLSISYIGNSRSYTLFQVSG